MSDTTIGPVIEAFEDANPGTKVELYRAPTGDLNARVAGDVRSGGLKADVVWACDPLTMQDYVDQGLVGGWTPTTSIGAEFRTDDYVGVALLYMVAVAGTGPGASRDLVGPDRAGVRRRGCRARPGPGCLGLGALGYFADNPNYGTEFYEALKSNGATQVGTPDDVVTGVAEGIYAAGMTTANSAYAAIEAGSPIKVSWPAPGAISIYGPVALAKDASNAATAKQFISYVTSEEGQRVIADAGSYPTLAGVPGPTKPADAAVVAPDWSKVSSEQDDLLARYQKIFGG